MSLLASNLLSLFLLFYLFIYGAATGGNWDWLFWRVNQLLVGSGRVVRVYVAETSQFVLAEKAGNWIKREKKALLDQALEIEEYLS